MPIDMIMKENELLIAAIKSRQDRRQDDIAGMQDRLQTNILYLMTMFE
jgi:hypothetical protein